MRTILIAIALLSATASARADETGVVVTGEATLQPQLAAHLEGWLRDHGHRLVASPLDPDAINTLIDCFVLNDESCARNVIDHASRAQNVVFARIEVHPGEDGTRDVTLVAYWLHKNTMHAAADRRLCEHCNEKELRGIADDLMTSLAHLALPEGTHEETPAVHSAPASAPESGEAPSRTLPYALIGGGAAIAVTGIALIAVGDQKPAATGPQQPTYRDYGPPGYALGAIGLAAVGVGVYLWLHDSKSGAPVAAVSGNSATVGWTGRF